MDLYLHLYYLLMGKVLVMYYDLLVLYLYYKKLFQLTGFEELKYYAKYLKLEQLNHSHELLPLLFELLLILQFA